MTWPITPLASIHTDPTALATAELQFRAAYNALQEIFSELPGEIISAVVNAILNAFGLSGVVGDLNTLTAALQSAMTAIPQGNVTGLISALASAGSALVQALRDAISNALGHAGSGYTDSNVLTFMGGMVNSFSSLVPTWLDNFDGTAQAVTGAIFHNDGTASFGGLLGSNPIATAVDNANQVQSLLNNIGVSNINQLTQALNGIIPAALDNLDGTATQVGTQIIQNLDGTATYLAQQAGSVVNALIDNIDGTAMPFFHSLAGGFNNSLGGLLAAFTGNPVTGTSSTQLQAQQAQVTAAAGVIQQRLITIGNGGEEYVNFDFSSFSNGSLPPQFALLTGSTAGLWTVSGGQLVFNGPGGSAYPYCTTPMLSDYQQVDAVFAGQPTAPGGAGTEGALITARVNPTGSGTVSATWQATSGSAGNWTLGIAVGTSVKFADTFTPGAKYSLVCGDPITSNPYIYKVLKNGTPLTITSNVSGSYASQVGQTYLNDTGHVSTVGGNNRSAGLGGIASVFGITSLVFQDTAASLPSVLVTTQESTSSTSYTDLTTTSDQVVVNIGSSGKAVVSISSWMTLSGSAGEWVTFAASGANIIAASDTYSIEFNSPGAGFESRQGASFMLNNLVPGLTTFKMKYRCNAGTATFKDRQLAVLAL